MQDLFVKITLIPNFLTARIAARTSSEISKFCAFDKPSDSEASNTHLILILLSPLTEMARNFHLNNGAIELQVNDETQNFEYKI